MAGDEITVADGERPINPKERVGIGPVPAWAEARAYDFSFKGPETRHLTYLLFSRQDHAEPRQAHFHNAVRLESAEAVQRSSQWSIQWQPKIQVITLHWIKIRRGELAIDQANLDNIRLLEREEGLEKLVIDGHSTLLLVLEDVRPGDVIDSCYTIETQPRLLANHYSSFFSLPQDIDAGNYFFSVRFRNGRPMRWKSSAGELAPKQTADADTSYWAWAGEKHEGKAPEAHTPSWHLAYPWVQVSDCPDWGTVATAVVNAWEENADESALGELAAKIIAEEAEPLGRVNKAIQFVQDEFRYLSVNLEFGGQVPQPPAAVLRKRYGDCKDLAFLLVHLLKHLGVAARPVLVHTQLRKFIGELLPMAWFNHVVVEFTLEGQTRWVDAVVKNQGGGALNRFIPNYGVGLPLEVSNRGLIPAPKVSDKSHLYELKESILLDTTGAASHLAVLLRARGFQADGLRHQLAAQGADELARSRQKLYTARFSQAKRVGTMEFRDDRLANEFLLAETFEINGFLKQGARPGTAQFVFPANLAVSTLAMPEKTPRKAPFLLPYPCNLVQVLDIYSTTQKQSRIDRLPIGNEFITFNRVMDAQRGWLSLTLNLCTHADAVPPERLAEHRTKVTEILKAAAWQYVCPAGQSHPHRRSSFGLLPPPPRVPMPHVAPQPTPDNSISKAPPPAAEENPLTRPQPVQPRTVSEQSGAFPQKSNKWVLSVILGVCLLVAGLILIWMFARKGP